MDYSAVKKIPFKGYTRAYETTARRLVTDPETGKEVVLEEKTVRFGEFVEDKENLPDYHEYDVAAYKHVGIVKISIEPDEE